jgi:hypothetical protein
VLWPRTCQRSSGNLRHGSSEQAPRLVAGADRPSPLSMHRFCVQHQVTRCASPAKIDKTIEHIGP